MNKEKQIEEIDELETVLYEANHKKSVLDYRWLATEVYNANYRKQSYGEWIVTDADSGSFGEYEPFIEFKCPKCESAYGIESGQYDWQYGEPIPWVACPLCGAKMKGGAE